MRTLIQTLTQSFTEAIHLAFPSLDKKLTAEITLSTQENLGHYQCNSALKLTKVLGQPPRVLAEKIVASLTQQPHLLDIQCEIAGPGFINIRFEPKFLAARLQTMLLDDRLGVPATDRKQKIIIDFSSPNTAKEMHVGHLRSTVIGDALANIFEFLAFDVLRLNHIGDWGTAFGMLIIHLQSVAAPVLAGKQDATPTELVKWYREAKLRFDEDPVFKKQAQLAVVALQNEEPELIKAWEIICEMSNRANQEIYTLLDINIINRGESFYNPFLKPLINDLESRGLIEISEGAKCLFLEGFKNKQGEFLPFILQKSDGGYNYATTDLAALKHRIEVEKAVRIIYVTDAGQIVHFQMLFQAAQKVGYADPQKVRCDHVPFGLVLGPDGKKFKTRSGETERLMDLLTAAIEKAAMILKEKDPTLSEKALEEKAHILGINAVKYADLSSHRTSDYLFSYDRMLQFEGNTATFLMYAYVRTLSIQRKAGMPIDTLLEGTPISLDHPSEMQLALHLNRFGEILQLVSQDLLPHHLTGYLYQLSNYFNAFFRDCRVEGSPEQNSRLLLCYLTGKVLHKGLSLLGLKLLDRM
jgi:arginyl-tRNA synthetase